MHRALYLLAGVGVAVLASPAAACFMRSPQPVQVWLDHIHVDIVDQVAVKTYHCTFKNPNPQLITGATCYMELEPGARVDNMSVTVDGRETQAEILSVEKANQVFTEMVSAGGSPALLEYFGNQLIQTKIPRIAAGGTVTVHLRYTTVLQKRGDLVRLQMLNTNPKALLQPLKSASVTVNIKSRTPIKNLYSPTHEIDIVETPDWDVTARWKQDEYLPTHPFVLYYQTAEDDVAAALLAHREADEEGAFMLMLSPTIGGGADKLSDADVLPKDIVFCVDTSGSMLEGGKMEQARRALEYCVEHLRTGDRFNIVDFSTTVRSLEARGLIELDDASRDRALRYIDKLAARGGTAIQEALETSLDCLSGDHAQPAATGSDDERPAPSEAARLKMIVFATDGLPTIGEREPEQILKRIAQKNTEDVRVFVFGEGFNVNTKLLDFLALGNRGESEYILPEEDIDAKIARFFDRVGSPVMTDLEISFEGLEVKDVFPRKVNDVFRGEQLVVYGRYTGHGKKTVRLSGNVAGQRRTFEYELEFPEISEDDKNSFVPRLWAGRKVDFLLSELRGSEAEDRELVEEITFLAKRYGIVTPYTSFLMVEDIAQQTAEMQVKSFLSRARAADGGLRGNEWGAAAVTHANQQALNRRRLVSQGNLGNYYVQCQEALAQEGRGDVQALAQVRYIGNRTFYCTNEVWYDSRFDPEKQPKLEQVVVGSKEYLKLLNEQPVLARYMAQGDVVVNAGGRWYQFQTRRG
ncbi:MAG: VIT and VWA domain-containing protein [Planctomycetes bacterium]|nr:VIT and VWA domain-containing protein [Planctomycetota bacterium]